MLLSPSRFCVCGVVSAVTLVVCSATVVTASDAARRAYGNGVHLLHQGRITEAVESFNLAAAELQDARIYYFRGLAQRRLGRTEAAEADFRRAANLEARTGRQNVGRALERIQGGDRLVIERYRRAAHRLAKSMPNQRAPRVVGTEQLPAPRVKPQVQDVVTSEVPTNLPPDERDPFSADATGLLGRGVVERVTHAAPADVATGVDDQPLGSGFDEGSLDEEPFPAEFDDGADFGSDTDVGSASPPAKKKRGIFGSVFRAVTKSALPTNAEQGTNLLNGIRGSIPLPGGQAPNNATIQNGDTEFPDAPMDDPEPFSEPAGDGSDSDPFETGPDPFSEPGNDDAGDPFSDVEDPFSDEGDPFRDDQ